MIIVKGKTERVHGCNADANDDSSVGATSKTEKD